MKTLIQRVREILGGEIHAKAMHDGPQETKSANGIVSPSAPTPEPKPRFVDSKRNPDLPDTKKWAELNRPSFTRRSRYVTYAGRDKRGNVVLLRRDLVSGEPEPEAMTPFALKMPEKE